MLTLRSGVLLARLGVAFGRHARCMGAKADDRGDLCVVPGHERYPVAVKPTTSVRRFVEHYADIEPGARLDGEPCRVVGRIVSKRDAGKKLSFLDIVQDGTRVQVLSEEAFYVGAPGAEAGATPREQFRAMHRVLRRGDVIAVEGFPGKSGKGELSVIPRRVHLLAPCAHNLPEALDDPDTRYRQRYLDLMVNPRMTAFLRSHLDGDGFVEVETPILTAMAGGASARPFSTRSLALDADLQLRIAPELPLKELVVGGLDRVYEIGRVFRNEGLTTHHNPEFSTCEFYQAHADYGDLMGRTEQILPGMAQALQGLHTQAGAGSAGAEVVDGAFLMGGQPLGAIGSDTPGVVLVPLALLSADAREFAAREGLVRRVRPLRGAGGSGDAEVPVVRIDLRGPYPRVPIVDGIEERVGERLPDVNDPASAPHLLELCRRHRVDAAAPHTPGRLLDALVGHFLEPRCVQPTFLTDHPTCLSPLARDHRSRPGLTERFELFVAGREVCNAYTELNDPDEQRRRFQQQAQDRAAGDAEAQPADEAFCTALEYGLPPTAGWGMGLDRVLMLLTGSTHIREVILFPALKPKQQPQSQSQSSLQ